MVILLIDLVKGMWLTMKYTPQPAKVKSLLEGDGWAKGGDGIYAKGGKRLLLRSEYFHYRPGGGLPTSSASVTLLA